MNGTAESPLTSLTQRPPPSTLTTLPQILSALSLLESEEAEVSNSLSALLTNQEPILNSLSRLQSILPHVDELYTEASMLEHKVSATARTAERVGGRVRTLDEEMRRVREASDRVQQVMELKVCVFSPPSVFFSYANAWFSFFFGDHNYYY
jgi:conserved oligomeric Golgi complex subunit 4